ncbi:hypothetical protein P7228_11225 [Altererythrobacter arenosus]|uniref:NUDIX hydrolase n=1 Tax=Altererythrobacter arenosus TaxID=3032592 RepID=A0ABY8FR29_9SPHN|nr:hypothetical protein [Altererythrobacter sp. CAU 1644]WFL76565.1 hypothetical protein P7228_11225 [Altererythrobacter sp. CAU 1644]
MNRESQFVMLHRTDGSGVACRVSQVLFVGRGERGAILNFPGGAQVNVHEDFDQVMALLEVTE